MNTIKTFHPSTFPASPKPAFPAHPPHPSPGAEIKLPIRFPRGRGVVGVDAEVEARIVVGHDNTFLRTQQRRPSRQTDIAYIVQRVKRKK